MQDKWLLHSVLMLVQSWMEPLIYLQTTLNRYDDAPDTLLNKTKWVSDKLLSLEQGVVVLIRKVNQSEQCLTVQLSRAAFHSAFSADAGWRDSDAVHLRAHADPIRWTRDPGVRPQGLQPSHLLQEGRPQDGDLPQATQVPSEQHAQLSFLLNMQLISKEKALFWRIES